MIDKERLENGLYWQKAWSLTEGCTKISPACENCWSEAQDLRFAKHPNAKISGRALAVTTKFEGCSLLSDHCFHGHETRVGYHGEVLSRYDNLDLPLHTRKPTVFCVWNDLFHDAVSNEFRDRAYTVMGLCPQHTFLVLTKRAELMAKYFRETQVVFQEDQPDNFRFPRLNVWHGVTIENQEQADIRAPHLLQIPGKRFVSIEPMLSAIDLYPLHPALLKGGVSPLHAVLLGGESGKKARPMHPEWVRGVRDQCAAVGVPFFFKQWGEWVSADCLEHAELLKLEHPKAENKGVSGGRGVAFRVGKKKAGRLLDGRPHDDLPWRDDELGVICA